MSKDRKDGKYVKPTDPIHAIFPYLVDNRIEAEVYIKETFDMTELKQWVDRHNETLDYKMTYFHALTAVLARTVFNRPLLNRFIQGHRVYQRDKVSVTFVAKNKMVDNAEDMMVVMVVDPNENALELSKRMAIDIFNTKKSGTNDLNDFLNKIINMPRWMLRIVAKGFKWLDYHGWLPESFTKTDSNYATLLLSNLGSIKTESCYHHLNNYGTNSIVITIGVIKEVDGRTIVDLSATVDERIAGGFYFAKSLKLAQHIINNPELLEEKFDKQIDYEF